MKLSAINIIFLQMIKIYRMIGGAQYIFFLHNLQNMNEQNKIYFERFSLNLPQQSLPYSSPYEES